MSKVVVINAMWHTGLPEPVDFEAFAEYVEPKGWKVYREWIDIREDPDTGEVHEGRWFYLMSREKLNKADGRTYMWNISLNKHTANWPESWDMQVDVAERGWKYFCEDEGIEP